MKSKLYFFLLTALCGLFGMNVWAQDLNTTYIDGVEYYEIGNADDLVIFAQIVNGGEYNANAVLTDDIDMSELTEWTAIGDWGGISGTSNACYKGHFDGQGHTINNFSFTSTHNYYGIFGVVSTGCLIENLVVKGTITTNIATAGVVGYARDATPTMRNIHSYLNINNTRAGSRLGGILGSSVNGTIVVDRCTYSGTMDGNDAGNNGNYGGIVGYVNNNASAHLQVTNCLFDGELKNTAATPGGCTFGGMVGYVGANPDVTITNCLSLGRLQSQVTGLFYGAVKHNTCSIVNSYYQKQDDAYTINGSSSTVTPTTQQVTEVDKTQLSSGEICYALNGDQTEINWFQTLMDDDYPTPYGSDVVYLAGRSHCDGTAYEGVTGYSNTPSAQDEHTFTNGFCTYCGALDETYLTPNGEGYFEIGTPAQLKWFAAYVNQVSVAANAVLTADIALTSDWTTPIGSSAKPYTGIFDGQGNKITGFEATSTGYFGIIGYANGATIKDFSVSGTMTVTAGTGSGIVGYTMNSTISGLNSALVITVPGDDAHHTAGVVGSCQSGNIISRCSFSGSVTVTGNTRDCFGGVCGYIKNDKVTDCASYGNVSYTRADGYIGGVVGYLNNASGIIKNCLATGTITYEGDGTPTYGGTLIGRLATHTAANITNNYWLENTSHAGIGQQQPANNFEVTAAQLASGEVAAKLGFAFRQNIGTDEVPVLDATHGIVNEITDAGYATLYVPDTDLTIPTGVEAYTGVILNEGWVHLNAVSEKIAAGEPVILKGNAGYYSFVPTTGATKAAENVLKGAAEDTEAAGKYILAMPEGKAVGFYKAKDGTIKAGKAYLEADSEVKAFYFAGDGATGINEVNGQSSMVNGQPIYNLAGQRMSKMQKGINIVDGKKILK